MISWIQENLQRHFKWVFIVLLVVIIIAFVFTIGAAPGIGDANPQGKAIDFYGVNLQDVRTVERLQMSASLSRMLTSGSLFNSSNELENEVLARVVQLHIADKMGIPAPTEAALAAYIQKIPIFLDSNQQFNQKEYNLLVEMLEKEPTVNNDVIVQVLRDDYRIDIVWRSIQGPGYVLEGERRRLNDLLQMEWVVDVASLSLQKPEPEQAVSDEDLDSYYRKNRLNYEIPFKVSVDYVLFPAKNFLANVAEPTESQLQDYFKKHQSEFKTEEGKPATLAAVKEQVVEAYRLMKAQRLAAEAASDLTYEIYTRGLAADDSELAELLAEQKLERRLLPAYGRDDPVDDWEVAPELLRLGLGLDSEHFYTDAVVVDGGAAVLFYNETVSARIPELDEIKDRVKKDYVAQVRRDWFHERGVALQRKLQQAATEGGAEEFTRVAEAEGLQVQLFDGVSLAKLPEGMPEFLLSELPRLAEGQVSTMITIGDVGTFAYIVKRSIVEKEEEEAQALQAISEQRQQLAAAETARQAIDALVRKGLEQAGLLSEEG